MLTAPRRVSEAKALLVSWGRECGFLLNNRNLLSWSRYGRAHCNSSTEPCLRKTKRHWLPHVLEKFAIVVLGLFFLNIGGAGSVQLGGLQQILVLHRLPLPVFVSEIT